MGEASRASALWADLGAGEGTFTFALADLLDGSSRVVAVDRDRTALERLGRRPDPRGEAASGRATILPVVGDLLEPDSIEPLTSAPLDGALFANSLHYHPRPHEPLSAIAHRLRPGGRIVVVEYDGRAASPWIPHPLPPDALRAAADSAALSPPVILTRHPSAYRGTLYSARITLPP